MNAARFARARRLLARTFGITILLLVIGCAAACPFAGRFLVVDEPLQRGDAIVVLAGEQVIRWLEAVDLYHEGYASKILLSPGYEDPLGERLRARGIRFPKGADIQRDAMVQLGVPADAIEVLPGVYDSTADEAAGTRRIAEDRGWKRLIVVTSKFHTRRTAFTFRRELRDTGIAVVVRGSRHDDFSTSGWWKRRSDLRNVTWELQKLLVYRLGLGK